MFDLDNKNMAEVVASFQIPIKPEELSHIQDVMNEDEPGIEKIAGIITRDVGLSAAIYCL